MEKIRVVAILEKSEVGEMWKETKVFDCDTPIFDILKWAQERHTCSTEVQVESFRGQLTITIAQ